MIKTYHPYEPDQQLLLPAALQEWLPDDHLAYIISDVVDQLDMSEVTARYERERRGGPPYHPRMMVKVLLYGYCVGVASSRRIAQRLHEDIAFRVLAANNTPDFRTISDFRKDNVDALSGLFVQVLALCQQAGLVKLGHVALDGTKVKANASKHKAMMEETIDNVGAVPREVSADAGYYSAKAVDELYALGVDPFVAPEQTRHGRVVPPAPRGRIPSHLSPRDRMRRKLQTKRGRQRYALRMQTVEPVSGQIKQGRGFRQFLLRGLEKVNGEWSLICTGHNLLKLFRFGANLHRKARADGPAQRIRNFAEVVSTALFAKLSGGRLGQPAKLVVAIHWR